MISRFDADLFVYFQFIFLNKLIFITLIMVLGLTPGIEKSLMVDSRDHMGFRELHKSGWAALKARVLSAILSPQVPAEFYFQFFVTLNNILFLRNLYPR